MSPATCRRQTLIVFLSGAQGWGTAENTWFALVSWLSISVVCFLILHAELGRKPAPVVKNASLLISTVASGISLKRHSCCYSKRALCISWKEGRSFVFLFQQLSIIL